MGRIVQPGKSVLSGADGKYYRAGQIVDVSHLSEAQVARFVANGTFGAEEVTASDAALDAAKKAGVSLADVKATGKDGSITKADVEAAAK